MEKYIPIIQKTTLFREIVEKDLKCMLNCLNVTKKVYQKNEFIIHPGSKIQEIGLVVSGLALIVNEDVWGGRNIISELTIGTIFAESFACLLQIPEWISVVASEETTVLFFNINNILQVCSSFCQFHNQLIQNLVQTLAKKNVLLTKKMEYLSRKTIRDKLLTYLSEEALKNGKKTFMIPFNRKELAEYLSVDRSALSNEISKLQKEGFITSNKRQFTINATHKL